MISPGQIRIFSEAIVNLATRMGLTGHVDFREDSTTFVVTLTERPARDAGAQVATKLGEAPPL